ncbi:MAG TPA: alanine racemase [Aurantimonas coralicida]|uniref:Alanine racemase n=2 Tax=root TaxID=1 RepID=A0A9C9NGM2_9HYPH|nr:alanine racemase [Aurantimonas coralicida]HEU01136.1 alanine racemase [Aurantimonas coralicida]
MPLSPIPAGVRPDRMPVVEIDRASLIANWRMLDSRNPGVRTGAAVKANGYGLGAAEVAAALSEAGCRDFFVAWAEEGATLRDSLDRLPANASTASAAPRIYVLQGLEPATVPLHLALNLTPVLSTPDDIAVWREGMRATARKAPAAVQLETGMNRLGLGTEDARLAADFAASGELDLCLVMSHLASADEATSQSAEQLERFRAVTGLFPSVPRSFANSAGVFLGADYAFDLTRPGIALYGGEAGPGSSEAIRTVARLTASVLQVRIAKAGEAVGYGAAARLSRDTRIATVGIGYADGYHRTASGAGVGMRQLRPGAEAILAGRRVPVLGRVSMDLTLLDVTDLPEDAVRPGARAEFFGPDMPIDAVATAAGTIAYELLTGLGPRVKRRWSSDGPVS